MNISSYLFGFILATLLGALFHLWRDGGILRLVLYLVLSWVGFLIGHLASGTLGFTFMSVGPVNLAGGIIGSVTFLFLGNWITQVQPELVARKES
ncbi:MAG: hypothetical protein PHW11_09445 [Anaerolineaceae bacterium]|jgi:hypothetical protein|nr:hypothetical protein [Anaerolineaceae bacterium]MDD4043005.1 hypothetical protein [Anaerolineaceae bacterium]MDD4578268.1 hypothetical protein [Anaerolineaceae bacterium]